MKKTVLPPSCALALKLGIGKTLPIFAFVREDKTWEYNSKGTLSSFSALMENSRDRSPLVRVTGFPSVNQHPGHFSPSVSRLTESFLVNIKTLIKASSTP